MATKQKRTRQTIERPPDIQPEELAPDLKRPVEDKAATPQMRAKWVRRAFSARGWPNAEHPGTVRDFLVKHRIPVAKPVR